MGDILKPLTVEPPLDPPEPIDYKAQSSRRDSMQKYTWDADLRKRLWEDARWNRSYKESEAEYHQRIEEQHEQEEINNWRQQSEDDEKEWAIAQSEEKNTM